MLKTLYLIFLISSVVFYAQTTTTVLGSIKDKDYSSFSLDSALVVGKDLNNLTEVLFSTYTDQSGSFQAFIISTGVEEVQRLPDNYIFSQNYPNPFNPSTKFEASIPKSGDYNLEIFDVTGSKIISQEYNLNSGGYTFDVSGLGAAGVKFYRLTGEDFSETKKMIQMDGSTSTPTVNISGGASSFALSKVNNLDMRIFASKEGYQTDSIDVSYIPGSVNTQDFLLSQVPLLDTIHFFTDQTLIPTNTPGDNASIIGKNGSSTLFSGLTNSNGEFSTDLIVGYVTNPNNLNEKIYSPSTITINSTRQNTLNDSETFTINGTDLVWINDMEQTLINKNGNASGNVTDNILVPINNASVKLYNNDNNSLLGESLTNSSGNYTLNYVYTGYENDISDVFTPIDSMKFDFSAANHNPKTIIKNFENPTVTNAVLDKNAYNLNATIKLYNTKGDIITDLDSVKITWPDGSQEMIANNNGTVTLNKSLFTLNSDTTATITHNHPEQYLNWVIGTTENPDKIERIYQNENKNVDAKIPLNSINNSTTEAYMVTKWATYQAGTIAMDDPAILALFQRPQFPAISSHHPSPAGYDTTNVVQFTWNLDNGSQIPQTDLDRANLQTQTFLNATQLPTKKLLNYKFNIINSLSDPLWQSLSSSPRNLDNVSYTFFYNGITSNAVQIANDGTMRILNSNSSYNTGSTNGNIFSEIFSSMTNTTGQLGLYTYSASGDVTDLGKKLIGISYLFKPGTEY